MEVEISRDRSVDALKGQRIRTTTYVNLEALSIEVSVSVGAGLRNPQAVLIR